MAAGFDLGAVLEHHGPTARGEMGWVYSLTTDRGRWAVKRSIRPQTEAEVVEDRGFVTAAIASGVRTPAMLPTVTGDVLLSVGTVVTAVGSGISTAQFRVYEWVDLLDPDPALDPVAVGAAVARLHRCGFAGSHGLHPWYSEPVGAARWDELVRELAAAGAPFAGDLADLRDEIVAAEGLLEPMANLITCHRDLFADNVRATTDGTPVVIDWDNQGLADPDQELAFVLTEFAGGSAERARLLVDAYRDSGGPGRVTRPGNFSMVIATLGHITERACARWLEHPPGDPERDRMADRFGEFSANPTTPATIAALLDAVAD